MVSLIDKSAYLNEIKNLPKLYSFYNLLTNASIFAEVRNDEPEIDRFYFSFIKSLQENDQEHFSDYYTQLSKRNPTEESPWIHNDFLVFVIICGVIKYQLDKEWILKVLLLRPTSTKLNKSINNTFNSLLNSNYSSNENLFEIIIVFLDILNFPQLSNDLLDNAYISIGYKFNQEYIKNDFAQLISLRAFDIIILSKEAPDSNEIYNLRNFKKVFLERVRLCQNLIYITLLTILIALNFYFIKTSENFKNYLNDISIIAGIFGIGLVVAIKWIKQFIGWLILKLFGYYKYYNSDKFISDKFNV
ncbi:MAG: hypothetical protein WA440_10860 [Ignavibacteriaceae bacterium]